MTPSIDERREVAERLRKTRGLHACNKDLIELELSERIGAFRKNGMSWDYICDRLADLIEPLPERTCRNVGGEDGTNGEYYDFACDACGFCCDLPEPSFCPNCGARVVEP